MGEDSDPDGERESGPSDADETTPTGGKPDDGTAPPSDQDAGSDASDRSSATAGEEEGGNEPPTSSEETADDASTDPAADTAGDADDDADGDADDDADGDADDDADGDADDDADGASNDDTDDDTDGASDDDTDGDTDGDADDDAGDNADDDAEGDADESELNSVDTGDLRQGSGDVASAEAADESDDGSEDASEDASDDGPDESAEGTEEDDGPSPPSEEELEQAKETAPPLDREDALERKEQREAEADANGEEEDARDDTEEDARDDTEEDARDDTEEDATDDTEDETGPEDEPIQRTEAVDTDPYGIEEAQDMDDGLFEGPDTDEEMPLADHIEEMMRRLGIVFLFGGIATLIAFPTATDLINYFWSYHIPDPQLNRPRLYGPLELVLTRLKVASLAGVVVGLPVFVYQTYRFMKPGLYHNERRYYLAAVPTSLILGSIGIMFAHFLVLPAIFSYFTAYTTGAAVIAFGLAETFNLIVVMLAFMAIVFQIPLFIMLAIMMNLVTRRWLEQKRLIFWGAFLGIAFIFSPDPTGMAPIIVTMTMIVLYEGTLALLRWTGN